MQKHAILPCEIKSREFESKLLLACCLVERGWTTVVGSRNDIHMQLHKFPRSVYVGKDVRFSSQKIVTLLKLLGHPFVAMDEEALFYLSRERYRSARVDGRVLRAAKALFAWGPDNALAWKEAPEYAGAPIIETGNGRIDLLRPELRRVHFAKQQELEAAHGPFVLINTNFGSINHFISNLSVKQNENPKSPAPPQGYFVHRKQIYDSFVELLPKLAKRFPDLNFVLRPHPSENHDIWRETIAGFSNFKVISEGGIIPWVLASKAIIHNGCTTGIEAYLLDKAPIAYMPFRSQEFDIHLANDVSIKVETETELFEAIATIATGKLTRPLRSQAREATLKQHVAQAKGPLASDHLANSLEDLWHKNMTRPTSPVTWPLGAIATKVRATIKRFTMQKSGHKTNLAYSRHRFPKTPLHEVEEIVAKLKQCLGRFDTIQVREHKEGLIFEVFQETRP
jgi:surface carbohydrate biosynthesis protein